MQTLQILCTLRVHTIGQVVSQSLSWTLRARDEKTVSHDGGGVLQMFKNRERKGKKN